MKIIESNSKLGKMTKIKLKATYNVWYEDTKKVEWIIFQVVMLALQFILFVAAIRGIILHVKAKGRDVFKNPSCLTLIFDSISLLFLFMSMVLLFIVFYFLFFIFYFF